MQLSDFNNLVEDSFKLEEGYGRTDILKLAKTVANKAANLIRKEHAAFVKKHKLDTKGGGGLAGSEADASWEDLMDHLLDELDSAGIPIEESLEAGALTEATKEEKQFDKLSMHFERLQKSADFLFRLDKTMKTKGWDEAIDGLEDELSEIEMYFDDEDDD